MNVQKPYGCSDYRQEMILIGLHERLRRENLSEEERQALKEEIHKIEEDRFR
ncbi:MAG: hypothetical protein JJV98_08730 [Desulfosarcina sp.]|nr:hypothetical protein [Desulfobacterales bacterium]